MEVGVNMLTYKDILFSTTKILSDNFNCDVIVENKEGTFENECFYVTLVPVTNEASTLKTPVDTGVLRKSWRYKTISENEGIVSNNIHYAPHVEYGHRTRGGKSFIDGRYMLTKSVEEIESELDNQLSILIENLWK